MQNVIKAVRESLSDELRKPKYRGSPCLTYGHCYVASEALYHLLGAKKSGFKPMVVRLGGSGEIKHWFLQGEGIVLDPTFDQFLILPDYRSGRGCGFLTRKPSKRAQIVIRRAKERLNAKRTF